MQALSREQLEIKAAAAIELKRRRTEIKTVFGIVSPENGLLRSIQKTDNVWHEVDLEPNIYIAEKLERVVKTKKRFVVLIGGRGSTKSVAGVDLAIADAKDYGSRTYFLREYQSSIKNSVHSLVKSEINRFGYGNFETQQQSINYKEESVFEFAGISRNIDSIKSTHGFKRFEIEEAQFISQASLNVLTPSLRKDPVNGLPLKFKDSPVLEDIETHPDKDDVSMVFIANPGSSADPFSQRFIEPYKEHIDKDGFYEDNLHLIVKINYSDNPWFEDSGLESERVWDYANMDRAYYNHKWLGEYNDEVDSAIIKAEWFDACIDAHKLERLAKAFKPYGAIIAAHDPSGEGKDSKGLAIRHGSIITKVAQKTDGEIDDGCDWATGEAQKAGADWFVWDGDGMGAGLKRQISDAFEGTHVNYHMFRGSLSGSGQDNADETYQPCDDDKNTKPKTYAETFFNNRAQYYTDLSDRCYKTYKCVVKGEYVDPSEMISFDSDGIDSISALRSEICRIPLKPNSRGLVQLLNKLDMMKLGIISPNRSDSIMMALFKPAVKRKRSTKKLKRKYIK